MPRLRRFLHLERPRDPAAAPSPEPARARRFAGVVPPDAVATPAAPSASGAGLERFGPAPEPPLELAGPPARADAERRALDPGAEARLAAARRAMGEALAREVGRRERRRLGGPLERILRRVFGSMFE